MDEWENGAHNFLMGFSKKESAKDLSAVDMQLNWAGWTAMKQYKYLKDIDQLHTEHQIISGEV